MTTMNVNYMAGYGNGIAEEYSRRNKETQNMSDVVTEKIIEQDVKRTEEATMSIVSPKDMTMEEYKNYIADKISQIPMHPTRMMESVSVTISEAGFEAMKNDPEYEAWVLNDLRVGWAQPDKWSSKCGGAFSTIYYGASKEECHAEMWSAGYQNGNGKKIHDERSQNSFWERRAENKKRRNESIKKQQEKKRLQKTAYEEYVQHRLVIEQNMKMASSNPSSKVDKAVINNPLADAIASYEANFAILDSNDI